MRRSKVWAWVFGLQLVAAANAYLATVNKTDYQEMHIVPAPGKVVMDGDLKDWDLSGAIEMYMDEASRATMSLTGAYMYDAEAFYIGGHVKDPTPMLNAAIIRYRTPGADKPKQHEYSSSVWKEKVDEVSELNDLPMHGKAEKDSYAVEVGVPWSVIGLKPAPGLTFKGDVGVIYGNEGGTINAVRYLWSDKTPATGVNNDVPTEMRMHPNDLGMWTVE